MQATRDGSDPYVAAATLTGAYMQHRLACKHTSRNGRKRREHRFERAGSPFVDGDADYFLNHFKITNFRESAKE